MFPCRSSVSSSSVDGKSSSVASNARPVCPPPRLVPPRSRYAPFIPSSKQRLRRARPICLPSSSLAHRLQKPISFWCVEQPPDRQQACLDRPSASYRPRPSVLSTSVPSAPVVPQRRPPRPHLTASSPATVCPIHPPIVHGPSSLNLVADQQTHLANPRSGRGDRRLEKTTVLHRSSSLQWLVVRCTIVVRCAIAVRQSQRLSPVADRHL
ncbi:hypothetical protein ACLOJK_006778 [Asimina triloba]